MPPLTLRILIIDDDPTNAELIELMLHYSDTEYEVTAVQTPEEGLRLAAAQSFDLYLLDYRLPGISGTEVCRTIRRMDADTPVVFFTGAAYEHERWEAMQAGANAYLIKPDDLKELTKTVERLSGARAPGDANRGLPLNAYRPGVST
jgi:CheY-like chemotaxis protein